MYMYIPSNAIGPVRKKGGGGGRGGEGGVGWNMLVVRVIPAAWGEGDVHVHRNEHQLEWGMVAGLCPTNGTQQSHCRNHHN